jgi:long-chain acyl-CoA synthetase
MELSASPDRRPGPATAVAPIAAGLPRAVTTTGALAETVPALFLATTARLSGLVALRHKRLGIWCEITWAEYRQRVTHAALGLRALGLRPGDRVAIIGENAPEWLIADLAVQCAGGVSVGIYTTNSAAQSGWVVEHAEAGILILEGEEQLDKWLQFRSRTPLLRHVVAWDMTGLRDFDDPALLTFDTLLALGRDAEAGAGPEPLAALAAAVRPQDDALIIYTSGTTGEPKGARLTHANVAWTSRTYVESDPALRPGPDDEVLSFLPLCHVYERMTSVWAPLRAGYTVNFVERPETVAANLREVAPTLAHGVPRLWEKYAATVRLRLDDAGWLKRTVAGLALRVGAARAERTLSGRPVPLPLRAAAAIAEVLVLGKLKKRLGLHRARNAVTGAAPISPDVLRFYHALGVPLGEGYGMTESSCLIATTPLEGVRPGWVGRPIPGIEVRTAPDGEILVRGPNVFAGYHRDPEATAAAIDADGWLHTGDVGELSEDGYLRIIDRKKDLIITAGGKNIAPQSIENRLKFSPYITDAVVIGDRRPYVVALIVLDEDNVVKFAQDARVPFSTYAELAARDEIRQLVQREINGVNAQLSRVESVRRFSILPKRLHHEDGEVTPTMKVRRAAMHAAWGTLIESMYPTRQEA